MYKKKIRVKEFEEGHLSCDASLDYKINKFIDENNINIIDIKYSSSNDRKTALIIYEVEEDV